MKCAKLTKEEFVHYKTDIQFFCRICIQETFPFSNCDAKTFKSVFDIKDAPSGILSCTLKPSEVYKCAVCQRINKKPDKGIKFSSCHSLVHRKCSNLSYKELNSFTIHNILTHWECQTCRQGKFSFTNIDDSELLRSSYNSNFNCSCRSIDYKDFSADN